MGAGGGAKGNFLEMGNRKSNMFQRDSECIEPRYFKFQANSLTSSVGVVSSLTTNVARIRDKPAAASPSPMHPPDLFNFPRLVVIGPTAMECAHNAKLDREHGRRIKRAGMPCLSQAVTCCSLSYLRRKCSSVGCCQE